MLIDIRFDIPDQVKDFIEEARDEIDDRPLFHHHKHSDNQCHGIVECLGEAWDYLTSCFG